MNPSTSSTSSTNYGIDAARKLAHDQPSYKNIDALIVEAKKEAIEKVKAVLPTYIQALQDDLENNNA